MLFMGTIVPMILGFLEGLTYLSMSDEQFQRSFGER